VVRIFPNRSSCLRLISALCQEQDEEWLTGKRYLDMSLLLIAEAESSSEQRRAVYLRYAYGFATLHGHINTRNPIYTQSRT
jgi:hypothetical protein